MPRLTLLPLTAALVLVGAGGTAVAPPRGVPRSLAHLYAGETFACLSGGGTVPASRLNDDYCDCADGSDEPGTAACASLDVGAGAGVAAGGGRFYCANKGFKPTRVRASLVNDGICDCCDGTDEWERKAGAAACADTCAVDGAAWRSAQAEAIRAAEAGAAARAAYAAEGAAAAAARDSRIAVATADLEKATAAKAAAAAAAEIAEADEAAERSRRTAAAAAGTRAAAVAALHLDELSREQVIDVLLELVREANASAALVPIVTAQLAALADEEAGDEVLQASWPAEREAGAEYRSDAAEAARAALAAAQADASRLDSELARLGEEKGVDFGPDAAFFRLKGKCFETRVNNQYTYKVCPFGAASQDSTSLGTFSGWRKAAAAPASASAAAAAESGGEGAASAEAPVDYSGMLFTGGQHCWNGPARSMTVTFECGESEALSGVDEVEKCTYVARLATPAACDAKFARDLRMELDDEQQQPAAHDEL